MSVTIKNFNKEKYKFKEIVSNAFNVSDLSLLHEKRKDLLPKNKLVFENESKTDFHKLFYSKMNNNEIIELEETFKTFIKNEIRCFFDEPILHQYMPSFRIHLPKDQAVHKWHYDSDPEHKHPDWEINIQIPLTDCMDTQATWIESVPGLGDFTPMNMEYGQYSIFNGNKCMHGNKENKTNKTRVSFDFRIMPLSRFDKNLKTSVSNDLKFDIGSYYRKMD